MMSKARKWLLTVLTVLFATFCSLFAISCGQSDGANGFELDKSKITVQVGKEPVTLMLKKDGEVYDGPVSWVAGDTLILSVYQGKVTGVRAGESTVKAIVPYGEQTYTLTCNVTVKSGVTATINDIYTYAGTGNVDVSIASGLLSVGAEIKSVSVGLTADGANATAVPDKGNGSYELTNTASSPLSEGVHYVFYTIGVDDTVETFARRVSVRGIEKYEDLFLLAPFDNMSETVYGYVKAINWAEGTPSHGENFGEYFRYTDDMTSNVAGMNQTKAEFAQSLKDSGYDGYLKEGKSGYDTVYRSYAEKYNATSTPRPFLYFNLFGSANPAWTALDQLSDDATVSIWMRTWFKGEGEEEYSVRQSNWLYFYRNMNTGVERIAGGDGAPTYDPVGGWSNYRIKLSAIREALGGANNIAFAVQIDGNQRGSFYFELYSVELMATNDIVASTNTADVSLPGLYAGYFDSYDWAITPCDSENTFSKSGSCSVEQAADKNAVTVELPSGKYEVTYTPKVGEREMETVTRTIYSGLVKNFAKLSDVEQTSWGKSKNITALSGDDIPEEVGVPTKADGYDGYLDDEQTQYLIRYDKFNPAGRVILNWEMNSVFEQIRSDLQETDTSKRKLKDTDYVGLWLYFESNLSSVTVCNMYASEGTAHANSDAYTSKAVAVKNLIKTNQWVELKISIGDVKKAMATKEYAKIQQNISGKPSFKDVLIEYDTICLDLYDGQDSWLTRYPNVYFYSAEFCRTLGEIKMSDLEEVELAYDSDDWDSATFTGAVTDLATGQKLTEGVDYTISADKILMKKVGEYALRYEVKKNGYSYGSADRYLTFERDLNAPVGYNMISDLIYGSDIVYNNLAKFGASGLSEKGKTGSIGLISESEYNALLAAGYRGSLDKRTVWQAKDLETSTWQKLSDGIFTTVFAGSSAFNDELIAKIGDSSVAMNGAYLSVWVKCDTAVNMRWTALDFFKSGDGKYSSNYLGNGVTINANLSKVGVIPADTWVELTWSVEDIRKALASYDLSKGLGFGFEFRLFTDVTAQTEATKGKTIGSFDVYSMELCFDDVNDYVYATEKTNASLPELGLNGFTENLSIYNGSKLLTQGSDYTYANGKISGLQAGVYTLKYVVSGDGIKQTTLTRNYNFSNQVSSINKTDINYWGWSANYQNVQTTTLSAQPKGYDGMRTDLTAVTGNSSDHTLRMGIDISALTSDFANMKDDQYLSVWVKFEWKLTGNEAKAPKVGESGIQLANQRSGDGSPTRVTLNSHFITTEQVNNGEWMNLCFMKDQLNVENIAEMKYLFIRVFDYFNASEGDPKTSVIATVYSVELMTLKNVIDLKPGFFYSTGWHNNYQVASNYGGNQKIVDVEAVPTGYNGTKTETTALYLSCTHATQFQFGLNVAHLTKNLDRLMDDNDYISIWIKYSTKGTWWQGDAIRLRDLPSDQNKTVSHAVKSKFLTDADKGVWKEVRITKAELTSSTIEASKLKWLDFYTTSNNVNGGGQEVWIYDVALVNVD